MLKQRWFTIMVLALSSSALFATPASTFVFNAQSTPDIARAVAFARNNQKTIIIQGQDNNQTQDSSAVYLRLNDFDEMVSLYLKKKTMVVQSGMTWNEAQQLVAPFGLSLKFIPAEANEPIFETINNNQTGLSPHNPLVADGVQSVQLLQLDGSVVDVSEEKTPQLWRGLFGAQGTLGVVLDVQLKLVKNQNLTRQVERMSYRDYTTYLHDQVQDNPDISVSFARVDVAPGKDFLRDIYAVSYWVKDGELAQAPQLHPVRDTIAHSLYQWSEKGDWEKRVRWQLEKVLLGNTRLHPDVTRADLLLHQARVTNGQIREVYYIPTAQFVPFMDNLRTLAIAQKWSFNEVSVGYLAKPNDLLPPAQQGDILAIAISLPKLAAEQKEIAPMLMNLALNHGGSFALDAFTAQDRAKMKLAYPQPNESQKLKAQDDHNNAFVSVLDPNPSAG